HVWTMLVALRRWDRAAELPLPAAVDGWKARWTAKYQDSACPNVRNVEDLNLIYAGSRATWATDPAYHTKTLAVLDRLFPGGVAFSSASSGPTNEIVFGRVRHPAYHDLPIAKPEGVGQNNLGRRSVKGVVWHRMLGTLWGTDDHFRKPHIEALTDYGVGVTSIDGTDYDGVIFRWNDPYGYQSGWASGPVIAPWGDGLSFIRSYGINAVNRDQVSIEISGFYETPLTERARESVVALTAYYADQYGIPWNEFPITRQEGYSFVRWHQEFCGPQEKPCPGSVVISETSDLIERVRQYLKRHQTGGDAVALATGPAFAPPRTYTWLVREEADRGLDRMIERTPVYYFPCVYVAIRETPRSQFAGVGAPPIGPPIEPGTQFRADYVFRSRGISWVLTPYGTRVRAAALMPKIQITANGTISVRREPGAQPEIVRRADV
ncbi:MAG: N-acetylmuramoyl-L-alanine amidase, partial [Thermomicrobiales bacterium]|nr:N-acetylmuramoyl-L-alanine amidase [Thermomicrobiales bacterium]